MVFEISGKIAIITGAASGIGYAYAEQLLKNGLKGVVIADVNPEAGNKATAELNRKYGPNKAVFIETDVTKENQFEEVFKLAKSTYGKIDILINNAGIMRDSIWEREIAINCNAVVRGSLLAIKYMGTNNNGKGGIVVNIASIVGLQKFESCPVYTGTKHFVIGLNRSFGTDYWLSLTGIKFLTMCPGVTGTPLISEADTYAFKDFKNLSGVLAEGMRTLPSQKPEDVAKGIITLITKGENGSVWVAEGGQPIYEVEIPDRIKLRKTN